MGLDALLPAVLCLLIGAAVTVDSEVSRTLKSVHMIMRHGNKQLDQVYEVRSGLLTDLGKNEVYQLGLFMRSRYPDLLRPQYDSTEIQIISSGANRVIQSANLFAYGLYQSYNLEADWSSQGQVLYQAVPVLSIPKEFDRFLQVGDNCPRRKHLKDRDEKALFIEQFLDNNKDIVDAYVVNTGDYTPILSKEERSSEPIVLYYDKVYENVSLNRPIPEWTKPFVNRPALLTAHYEYFIASTSAHETKVLQTGSLVQLLIKKFLESVDSGKKMQVYAAHDFTLIGLMNSLGLEDTSVHTVPPTASALILELHQKNQEQEPYLQVYFRNSTTQKTPWRRQFQSCPDPCYLSQFIRSFEHLIPSDYNNLCQLKQSPSSPAIEPEPVIIYSPVGSGVLFAYLFIGIAIAAAFSLMIAGVAIYFAKGRRNRLYNQI